MKEGFALRAVRQILSIFDIDIGLQGHTCIGDLKPSWYKSIHRRQLLCKYEHQSKKN